MATTHKIPTRREQDSLTLEQAWGFLRDHIHGVFIAFLTIASIGIVVVSLLPNVYSATTIILVDPQKIPEKYVSSTIASDPNARMTTLTQQILSASRLEEIIEKENLYPELRKKKSREEVLDFVRHKTKIEMKESPEPEQGLSSFSITYEDDDRLRVAQIANDLAANFITWNLKARQQQAVGTTQFLSGEVQRAKSGLEQQERALEGFKLKHIGATPDELNANMQAISRLQSEAQADMDAIGRLDQERILLSQSKVSVVEAPIERMKLSQDKRNLENELRTLKRQFTDTYPDVIALQGQIEDLERKILQIHELPRERVSDQDPNTQVKLALVNKELDQRKARLQELQTETEKYQSKVDSVPVLETQLAELTRNYEASRSNYQSLLDKTFSAGMSEELEKKQQAERYTILDHAKAPEKPIRPKRIPIIVAIVALSLFLPAGIAILSGVLKGTVLSEADVRKNVPLSVPVFATIPPIKSEADIRWNKILVLRSVTLSVAAVAALVFFLVRVRPVL